MTLLPPELTDRIIDFLNDDYHTLRTCAIVCRDWLPSTRFHIFQNYRPELDKELIERSPGIGHLIRKIKISPEINGSDPLGGGPLAELCERFPNVEDILLRGFRQHAWRFPSLLHFISSVTALRTLGLEGMEIPIIDTVPSHIPSNSIEVLTLNSVDWDLELFMDRAISTGIFSSVHTLFYSCNYGHKGGGVFNFLRHYGSNLLDVTLERLPGHCDEELVEALSNLKNVRNVCISFQLPDYRFSTPKTLISTKLPLLLQGIKSPSLTKFCLGLHWLDGAAEVVTLDMDFRRELSEMLNSMIPRPRFECIIFAGHAGSWSLQPDVEPEIGLKY